MFNIQINHVIDVLQYKIKLQYCSIKYINFGKIELKSFDTLQICKIN